MQEYLTVTALNTYIRSLMESDEVLLTVSVRGEISNLKPSPSGHYYFTLKDAGAAIGCVMFRSDALRLSFIPRDGDRTVLFGNVSYYEKTGNLQLYVRSMIRDGVGDLARLYEERRQRFLAEGLFDPEKKKAIPAYPKRIGVVTSPTGAVIHDIIKVSRRRFPLAEIVLFPASVQGERAVSEICAGIGYFNATRDVDVLLVGRGGGSLEDLWAFNEEEVVRAVAASEIPVISCVGHETDTTLCDFAADLRAPTPSAAAEMAVPDRNDILLSLDGTVDSMTKSLSSRCVAMRAGLQTYRAALNAASPEGRLIRSFEKVRFCRSVIVSSFRNGLARKKQEYLSLAERIDSLSPLAVLRRGYAAVQNADGKIVSSVEAVTENETLTLTFTDGGISAKVISTERKHIS